MWCNQDRKFKVAWGTVKTNTLSLSTKHDGLKDLSYHVFIHLVLIPAN